MECHSLYIGVRIKAEETVWNEQLTEQVDDTVFKCQIPKGGKRVSPEPMLIQVQMVIDEDQK